MINCIRPVPVYTWPYGNFNVVLFVTITTKKKKKEDEQINLSRPFSQMLILLITPEFNYNLRAVIIILVCYII